MKSLIERGPFDAERFSRSFPHKAQQYQENRDLPTLHCAWRKLVGSFACRRSTDARDRFPAISGLAKLMAETKSDTYLAGLWSDRLV
jgi:hypothetical protein